jgi:hypothetical protein
MLGELAAVATPKAILENTTDDVTVYAPPKYVVSLGITVFVPVPA